MNTYHQRFKTIEERFWEKVDKSGDCWEWTGALTRRKKYREKTKFRGEYGVFVLGKKTMAAHRMSYILTFGEIPVSTDYHGICVLHRCDNPKCVRPDHLFLGTHRENMRDRNNKKRHYTGGSVANKDKKGKRFTHGDVRRIRELLKASPIQEIADMYDVGYQAIWDIKTGKTWRNVK